MGTFGSVIRFGSAALVAGGAVAGVLMASPPAGASGLSWSTVPTPAIASSQLSSVACIAAADCWAVGMSGGPGGTPELTLAEHWDGAAWSIVTTPNVSSPANSLNSVDCVGSSDCWAVGDYSMGGSPETLAEHWNGAAWSIVATPDAGTLAGVACISESECWAVGDSGTGGNPPGETLVERWNGTTWSVVPTPNNTSWQVNSLYGVACVSSSDCWGVGASSNNVPVLSQTLAEHWDGTAWSIVATPNSSSPINDLFGVSCVRNSDCWAVGATGNDEGAYQTLAEHWRPHHAAWSVVPTPLGQGIFLGVACVLTTDCWALSNGGIEHWRPTTWSVVAAPDAALDAVTCATGSNCWAVGFTTTNNVEETVAEHGTRHQEPS